MLSDAVNEIEADAVTVDDFVASSENVLVFDDSFVWDCDEEWLRESDIEFE